MVNMTWKFPLDNQTFEICSQGKEVIVNGEDIPVQWQGGGWSSDVEHCDLTIGTHNIHIRVGAYSLSAPKRFLNYRNVIFFFTQKPATTLLLIPDIDVQLLATVQKPPTSGKGFMLMAWILSSACPSPSALKTHPAIPSFGV